jgi:hypothetical protein
MAAEIPPLQTSNQPIHGSAPQRRGTLQVFTPRHGNSLVPWLLFFQDCRAKRRTRVGRSQLLTDPFRFSANRLESEQREDQPIHPLLSGNSLSSNTCLVTLSWPGPFALPDFLQLLDRCPNFHAHSRNASEISSRAGACATRGSESKSCNWSPPNRDRLTPNNCYPAP